MRYMNIKIIGLYLHMKEKCGVFGVYSCEAYEKCLIDVIRGLRLLQHRGQEGCGIAFHTNDSGLVLKKGNGLVDEVFDHQYDTSILSNKCIGHVRYSTSGIPKLDKEQKYKECQPLLGKCKLGIFYLVHNGNIPNIEEEHDTQYIIRFIEESKCDNWREILIALMESIPCAYCLLIITADEMFAVRDRFGIRPLCIGQFSSNGVYCVSSESCALQHFQLVRDVKPGEIIRINQEGLKTLYQAGNSQLRICSFEYLYFQNPTSICEGRLVSDVRSDLGKLLAQKEDIAYAGSSDDLSSFLVVGVPKTGIIAAKSYAKSLRVEYKQVITKNKNIGRTFIAPSNDERQVLCRKKFAFDETEIKNKNIIIVDDTIVRGNVMKSIVSNIWHCGASQIHIRIPAPPVINICRLGIDIPSCEELLAYGKTIQQIKDELGVSSIRYLTCDDLDTVIPSTCYKEYFGEEPDDHMLYVTVPKFMQRQHAA